MGGACRQMFYPMHNKCTHCSKSDAVYGPLLAFDASAVLVRYAINTYLVMYYKGLWSDLPCSRGVSTHHAIISVSLTHMKWLLSHDNFSTATSVRFSLRLNRL